MTSDTSLDVGKTIGQAAVFFGVPIIVLGCFLTSVVTGSGEGWVSGPEIAVFAVGLLFGFYVVLVAASATLAALLHPLMGRKPQHAANLAMAVVMVGASLFGAYVVMG